MDRENNTAEINPEIIESLEDLISVCKKLNCQFRIFGSLIYAAVKGDFYRQIGDIDCFIGSKFRKDIISELEKMGYTTSIQKDEDIPPPLYFIGFKTENFLKNNKKISLLYALFKENYMEIPLKFGFSFRVPYNLINKNYKFYGNEFQGLTPEAVLFILPFVQDKTKRENDLNVLLPFCDLNIIKKMKNTDTFFWFGKRVPLISSILASKIDKLSSN